MPSGEPAEYAARAVALGFDEIGFSDHSPMKRDDFDDWRMRLDQLDEYVEKVRRTQRDFPNLTIKMALEVDFLPGHQDWIRYLAARYPWDYFIGSVHYVADAWAVDNPQDIPKWKDRDAFEVWSIYFERLAEAAESGLFEIIGHADLPKKFKNLPHAGLHAAVRAIPGSRGEDQRGGRTKYGRAAQRLPGDLSQPDYPRIGRPPEHSDYFRLGRARARGSGKRFRCSA